MIEGYKRSECCCFTGHRPEKLHKSESEIISSLEKRISEAIDDGYTIFISGMSRGVDIWSANIVLRFKELNPAIRLIAALPYEGMGSRWKSEWKKDYINILDKADFVECFSEKYSRNIYLIRDKWMVDMSSRVIAVYHGEPGGTKNTMDYAEKCGIEVIEC